MEGIEVTSGRQNSTASRSDPDSRFSVYEAPAIVEDGGILSARLCAIPDSCIPMTVRHETNDHRFVADVEGGMAELEYTLDGKVASFVHTLVPKPSRGQDVGTALVEAALEWARAEEMQVVPGVPVRRVLRRESPRRAGPGGLTSSRARRPSSTSRTNSIYSRTRTER